MRHEDQFQKIVEGGRGLRCSLSATQISMIAIGGAIGTDCSSAAAFAISFASPRVLISDVIGALVG
jgi:L-asparagine transporter-like permease